MWRLLLQSTVWRLFYDVETFIAVYGVETFLQCGDFRSKQLLTGFELFSQIGGYVRNLTFYPIGHRPTQCLID